PFATLFRSIALVRSSSALVFLTYPMPPASRTARRYSSSACMVRTRTRVSFPSAAIRRVASRPPMPGMERSMTTTSGFSLSTASIASSPVPASPTTTMSSSASRRARSPARRTTWSSARRMRIGSGILLRLRSGYDDGDLGTGAGPAFDVDASSDVGGAFFHAEEAEPAAVLGHRGGDVEAPSVVADHGFDESRPYAHPELDAARVRVADHVGERLLEDPVERELGLGRESPADGREVAFDGDPRRLREGARVGLDGRREAEHVERRRTQSAGDAADLFGGGTECLADLVEVLEALLVGPRGAGEPEPDSERRERLGDPVVQLAGDALAFLLRRAEGVRRD